MDTKHAKLRVALVEDEGLFRDLLRMSLGQFDDIEVVGDFADADSALERIPAISPDVLILDVNLGKGCTGIELGKALWKLLPEMGILVLSNHIDPSFLAAFPQQRGRSWSYLVKKSIADFEAFTRAIRGTAAGFAVLDHAIACGLGAEMPYDLTPREREITELLVEGYSNRYIAQQLCVSDKTIEHELAALYRRLEINTKDPNLQPRVRAAALCLKSHMRNTASIDEL